MDKKKIEEITGYIGRTVPPSSFSSAYDIGMDELAAIIHLFSHDRPLLDNLIDIVALAFYYGRAKGVRATRATQRREVTA